MTCIEKDCRRKGIKGWSRCEGHIANLMDQLFGPRR